MSAAAHENSSTARSVSVLVEEEETGEPPENADFDASWARNWPPGSDGASPRIELPPPPADIFITAGAIVAERAARGDASRSRVEEILKRAVEQGAALKGAVG